MKNGVNHFSALQLMSPFSITSLWWNYLQLDKLLTQKNNRDLQLNLYKTILQIRIFVLHFRAA